MSATQSILSGRSHTFSTIDKNGRKFLLRVLTALDTLRLFKAAGPALSQNEPWLAMASLASSVQEIEGVPVPAPTSEAQIEALIDRLGEDGLAAIATAMDEQQTFESPAHVGNLRGTPF